MEGEQDTEAQTLAQRFLQLHRPAVFGTARGDNGDNDEGIGDDNETEEPREADGELNVDAQSMEVTMSRGMATMEFLPRRFHRTTYSWLLVRGPRACGDKCRNMHWNNMSMIGPGVHTVFRPAHL